MMTEAPEAMVPMAVQNELLEGRKLLESMEPQQLQEQGAASEDSRREEEMRAQQEAEAARVVAGWGGRW